MQALKVPATRTIRFEVHKQHFRSHHSLVVDPAQKSRPRSANKHGNGEAGNDFEPGELEGVPFCAIRPRARGAARPEAVHYRALPPQGSVGVHRDRGVGGEGLGARARRVSSTRRGGGRRHEEVGKGALAAGVVQRAGTVICETWRWFPNFATCWSGPVLEHNQPNTRFPLGLEIGTRKAHG